MRFTRIFGREDEQELEPMESDDDVRQALARLDRYGSAARPADRRKPADTQVHPLGQAISLWPR